MIEAKDLRIGNYFEVYEKRIEQVSELRLTSIQNYINEYFEVDCKPIPLTEEWLIKFGFGISEFDNEMIDNVSLKDVVIGYNYDRGILELEGETESLYLNHIKHVHQLQNLYFALTGEELTIKG